MSDRDQYFAAARTWAEGQVQSSAREVRIAWRVATGAAVVALLLALALVLLVPLKSVQPYVLTVDRNTGAVEAATRVQDGRLSQNEAVIQAQLAGYVIARETLIHRFATAISSCSDHVGRAVARAYVGLMAANNTGKSAQHIEAGATPCRSASGAFR